MEIETTEKSENEKKTGDQEDVLCLKKKGDEFRKEKKFKEALECYNKAIEQDQSNLELLFCRAATYYHMEENRKCIGNAEKLVALSSEQGVNQSMIVFKALIIAGRSCIYVYEYARRLEFYLAALQIPVSAKEKEPLIKEYNGWSKGFGEVDDAKNALNSGIARYSCGGRAGAIKEFTESIGRSKICAPAYACRAICYSEGNNSDSVQLTENDVKSCIELDYRYFDFFRERAEEMRLSGQMDASFKLYRALVSSEETYKLSIGRFFPKLLDNKQLNKSEKKHFEDLEESWRKNLLPTLERLNQNSDSE